MFNALGKWPWRNSSSGRSLANAAGADYVLHAGVGVAFPIHASKDGDRLPLGNVVVDVLHTPGHTPEHVCLLVTDRSRADEPWFALTGHTLMVGDVGRTELAEDAASAARTLFAKPCLTTSRSCRVRIRAQSAVAD